MGVTLSPSSIPKLRQAIADGEAFRMSRGGERLPAGPIDGPFWALITGMDFVSPLYKNASKTDLRMVYSFVRVAPSIDAEADLWVGNTQGYKIFPDTAAHIHEAIEINGNATPANSLVRMMFTHWEDVEEIHDGKPMKVRQARFAFAFTPTVIETFLPNHDHRDNVTGGGFAFACYHPGTGLPQQPWAL